MENRFKTKWLILCIIVLTILTLVTGYYAFSLREKYNNMNNNNYTEAFSNLVNYVNSVENYLAKSMISKSPAHSAETLTQVWRDSNLAIVYLSRIPLENDGLSQTSKFLNQVSDYAYSLSRKNIEGEELSDEDFENLNNIYELSVNLENTLNQLSEDIFNGKIDWENLNTNSNGKFAESAYSISVFSNIDENLNNYEGLIYDGAYSDHVNKAEKVGLTGDDIDEKMAENVVKEFVGTEFESIINTTYLENADIPAYNFVLKLQGRDENFNIMISKKGGHVIETSLDREVYEEKITQEEANQIGKSYLESKNFPNMKETYFIKQGNIVTINYAYDDDGIIVYPDLIKVRVALDNGEILGMETTGYLNSHQAREYSENIISIEDARSNLNENLEILSENMAVIPTEWKTEILCYEFKGKVNEKEFLVYINAETGKEEDILVILDTPGGTLTV